MAGSARLRSSRAALAQAGSLDHTLNIRTITTIFDFSSRPRDEVSFVSHNSNVDSRS